MDLKSQVKSIIHDLENPSFVDEEGTPLDELPNYARTVGDVWVKDYARKVTPDQAPLYAYDPEEDTFTDTTTGETFDFWREDDDGNMILGGEEDYSVLPMTGSDYLSDVLDIEYIVSGPKPDDYLGARVLVTFGGPTIWINTRTNQVEGHWWGDHYTESFEDNIGLDETLREVWACQ